LINIETTSGCASFFGFAWFLVACVTSKKFIKLLRKSLKEFGLNLNRKVCFKKSLKKKRKKEKAYLPSLRPSRPAGPPKPSRSGPSPSSPFSFSRGRRHLGPACQPLPSPFFLLSHPAAQPTRHRRAIPTAPRHFPSFPPHQAGQLRQLTSPAINWSRYPSLST
jgi:hypothetical protein